MLSYLKIFRCGQAQGVVIYNKPGKYPACCETGEDYAIKKKNKKRRRKKKKKKKNSKLNKRPNKGNDYMITNGDNRPLRFG